MEIWKEIPGYEAYYEVSTYGNVRSLPRISVDKNGRKFPCKGKELKLRSQKRTEEKRMQYTACVLCVEGHKWSVQVQYLVLTTFVGPRPLKHEICHIDGDPHNNKLENLRYGTASENRVDSFRHKTDRSGWHKLSYNDVMTIRHLSKTTPRRVLAKQFNVHRSVILAIADWARWENFREIDIMPCVVRGLDGKFGFAAVAQAGRGN